MKSLSLQQTMIPVLLTSGVMFSLFSVFKPIVAEDSWLGAVPSWMSFLALGVGLAFIALGILNMLLVRQQLITQAAEGQAKKKQFPSS